MFDIGEYCAEDRGAIRDNSHEAIDFELVSDISDLVAGEAGSLYLNDRYRNKGALVEIMYPADSHASLYSHMLSPERLRFLLSLYPRKIDLQRLSRIVIRPRYIEAGEIELAALYIKSSRTLVLYLTSSGFGSGIFAGDPEFVSASLEKITLSKIITDSVDSGRDGAAIPALWNIISVIDTEGEGGVEKFFIRRPDAAERIIAALCEISEHYTGLGY
ncbi:MAG TPA: hypothetical protein PK986_11940 [Spirochaetota bacterium]|nr:hypothetical protein [Spirochaetota bacterium]HQO41174.1 hypothetical protein [Spirochaetota bacterium]